MSIANASVALLLRSPLHPLLDAKVQLIRYTGRRSGAEHRTPTQYVELGHGQVAILVGDPDRKNWWKNFDGGWPLDLLIRGSWRRTQARSCWHHDDPETVDDIVLRFGQKYGERHAPTPEADTLVVLCGPSDSR
jgi:hypothetical protein